MSRGFDGFEIDDFRGPDSDSERGMGGGSTSSWDKWRELQKIYREEERTDNLAREGQQRSGRQRPPVPRGDRVSEILEQRTRTNYADRNKTYSLRDSEIHTLAEVGKFRVVGKNDLAEFAYNRDFHSTVIDSSGNSLLTIAAQPIFLVLQTNLARSSLGRQFHRAVHEQHRRIIEAVEAGDAHAAGAEMHSHLEYLRPFYEKAWRHAVGTRARA